VLLRSWRITLVLLLPLAYTIGVRYNVTNEALIGACFLPEGLGKITPVAGSLSDRVIVTCKNVVGYGYPRTD